MREIVKLRQLPGIAELDAALHVPGRQILKEYDNLEQRIDEASRRYFGIGVADTFYRFSKKDYLPKIFGTRDDLPMVSDEALAKEDQWESNFAFLTKEWSEENAFWNAAGFDVNDDNGQKLIIMRRFARQLVCVVKQLLPEAVFSPAGARSPINEELLASRLEREAQQFMARKRRSL